MEAVWGQFTTVPLFLILFLFPLVNLKSATFFTKFNALGTVSILFILSSVLYRYLPIVNPQVSGFQVGTGTL